MTAREVRDMARGGVYEGTRINGSVEETHISWVILSGKFAFKIKKPVRLDFLDFSSLRLRKQVCERELWLNRRFSDIYLDVLPVRFVDGQWLVGGGDDAHVMDYCVVMRRMAVSKRLDNVIRSGSIHERYIETLAVRIAAFHNNAERIFVPFDITKARDTFNAIGALSEFAPRAFGVASGQVIARAMTVSNMFLEKHQKRFQERIDHGLKRDVHGDLHCANIFLYRNPVIFDCVEFNDQFRQIDVLYEIAFLCMDLERFHQKHLAKVLLKEYRKRFPAFQQPEDDSLFVYFKSLRANIRAKVHAMQWSQAETPAASPYHVAATRTYIALMNEYIAGLPV